MLYRSTSLAVVFGVLLLGIGRANAQDKLPAEAEKSADAVKAHLEKLKGAHAQLIYKDEPVLAKVFPEHQFIVARYRQFPVARIVPEGLRASNVFAVTRKEQKVQHIADAEPLKAFFKANQVSAKDEAAAKAALAAWLTLAQEFRQDGFYKFEILEKEFASERADGARTVRGRALVVQGGKGELGATLVFENDKPATITWTEKLMPGPRPICQATKLLDRDPIVRRMAEQDLLFMGLPAHDYLLEQREKAAPELRRAIDRLWRQIRENGW